MRTDQVVQQAKALRERIQVYSGSGRGGRPEDAAQAQVCEFLRQYAGPHSSFLKQAEAASAYYGSSRVDTLSAVLESFVEYLEAGLSTGISPERKAQLDVVSDILGQAQSMLEVDEYHPASAAMLVGASLEQFLRNWVEAEGLSLGNAKPGINAYGMVLRTADLISSQDIKDITSWAGIRNNAAHGQWDQVSDRGRIRLMFEGVNLFMRQKVNYDRGSPQQQ